MSLREPSMAEYEEVDSFYQGDYEWSVTLVYRRKADGKLFYVNDSGCSCNSPGEDVRPADLEPLDDIKAFREALRETARSWGTISEVEDFVAQFFTKKNTVRVKV